MIRIACGLALGMLLTALAVYAEELTLTTYYPSPRGAYEEIRTTRLVFTDTASKDPYQLTMEGGKLVIEDVWKKKFVIADVGEAK